jgi:hypothetical protein
MVDSGVATIGPYRPGPTCWSRKKTFSIFKSKNTTKTGGVGVVGSSRMVESSVFRLVVSKVYI